MIQILRIGIFLVSISFMSCHPPYIHKENKPSSLSLIPKPNSIQLLDGQFDLKRLRGIVTQHGSDIEKQIGQLFSQFLNPIRPLT